MFEVFHTSRSKSRPVYLYDIAFAAGEPGRLRVTSASQTLTVGGNAYAPAQVRHGEIVSSGSLDKTTLELKVPRTSPLIEIFRVYPPEQVVNLTILQGELDDPDGEFTPVWSGRILNLGLEGLEATFSCEPIATAVRRPGLRRTYQYGCPHVLYGPQCRASKAAATTTATVQAISGSTVTLNSGWNAEPTAKYLNGLLEWTGPSGGFTRTVLQVPTATQVLIGGLVRELDVGDSVSLVLGCSHGLPDCRDLHDNILNYGGQPWIPLDNPLGTKTPFY